MLFISVNVLAQSASIKGKVIDAKTQTAVEYASIASLKMPIRPYWLGKLPKKMDHLVLQVYHKGATASKLFLSATKRHT